MKVVKTSTKGQVVIPAGLRAQIGLRPGAKVVVRLTGDGAVQIRPLPKNPSAADAEHFLDLLPTWPIQLMHTVFDDVLAAARLKARFPISYADAFAAATALRAGARLVTGDDEFHALDDIVDIVWLPS